MISISFIQNSMVILLVFHLRLVVNFGGQVLAQSRRSVKHLRTVFAGGAEAEPGPTANCPAMSVARLGVTATAATRFRCWQIPCQALRGLRA
jgi:hypothetical protein